MNFKRNGSLRVEAVLIFSAGFFLIVMEILPIYIGHIDPITKVTFTGVVEMIDDTTMELNTGQDNIQIQLDIDDTKILKHIIHQGTKGSFYLTHHKKSDTFVLKGLTHFENDGLFSSKRENNVKIIE